MSDINSSNLLKELKLGKETTYVSHYDPSQLEAVPRALTRESLPKLEQEFTGYDLWTGYEISWLDLNGKPIVKIGEFRFSANSDNLVESKSFKLYLNSFNQSQFSSVEEVVTKMTTDLAKTSGLAVEVKLFDLAEYTEFGLAKLVSTNLDKQAIKITEYDYNPDLLKLASESQEVTESICSHLLKSNCLVTGQPDWGSLVIEYTGQKICHEGLLKYIISFRGHNEFHEHCVERIYSDIQSKFNPKALLVYARYTRRGGLDINPLRASSPELINQVNNLRLVRQ
ncbi:NADPH-dependent 7-cyano-7-deazaguanine reductase QueF [Catenovulum maritimum]|uniref:NADPH-dependent 7-cyano-7-deazaguanine reductase n=1 Tax=Catenovulum maritimum TaxID=1513271 RepID=A0A0J8GSH5_9ALTE|nr:NADPH-dependent 7-cyano-7-deazaguanine reductase QueF [Catenovulum maritimum]KMT65682.1 hypothetical protein XM47_08290 [Catenovulum maritimum]